MAEVSTPRDEIPLDVLHERLSRESATEAPETSARDAETRSSLAGTTSSDGAVSPTSETHSMGEALDTETESGSPELAIDVEDFRRLYFHGVKRREQRGLDLKVPKGIIYGLIGKESSGLMSLLGYILGLSQCLEGRIRVLGSASCIPDSSAPGTGIGYTRSPGALTGLKLTVREYLHFLGKMYGMSETSIQDRIKILWELLSLPDDTLLLGDLSVDGDDLVSLAAGLIHSPALLLLVSPFRSSEPIVKMRIWSNLRRLTREEGLTILLASSDFGALESQCDMVGIMCSGRIVAEGPPRLLLDEFKTDTLEEVFLQLTLADEEKPVIDKSHLNKLTETHFTITETRNQRIINKVTPEIHTFLGLNSTRETGQRGMPHESSGRLLELTKMNLILLTRGNGFYLKQLLTCLLVYYAIAGATLVFCHKPIASGKSLNISTDLLEDISNISTASPGDTLEPDRDPSATESMLCGLIFSLIYGMGIAVGTIGKKIRTDTVGCYAAVGARPCDIFKASRLTYMCVMLILEAFLLVPVFACFRSSDSIHPESVALIVVLCYLQGLQGMLFGTAFANSLNLWYGAPILAVIFQLNTCYNGTTVKMSEISPTICRIIHNMMPQRHPGKALECIIFRGWGIPYYEVWSGMLISVAWLWVADFWADAEFYTQWSK